ncbi:MAG: thiamine pyrophosphate-dependent enzyme, partial [Betaproteobacteria bacterium]
DQGAIVRPFVKWDDQPASPAAAREAVLRANWIARSEPCGPVYVNLDAGMQEASLAAPLPPIDVARYAPDVRYAPDPYAVRRAASMLGQAARPLILMGRVSRDERAWRDRVRLAERLAASVVTDLKVGAAFPTDHPQHVGAPALILPADSARAIASADVVLSLDWVDLAGTLATAFKGDPGARIVHASLDHLLHNGWSMDHQGLPPVDIHLASSPDAAVTALLDALGPRTSRRSAPTHEHALPTPAAGALTTDHVALALRRAVGRREVSLAHLPLSWNGASWPFRGPLAFLGSDGGGGVGAGPGLGVGAALALRDRGILTIAVCGDGDFLMGATALWTAVHYRIPLLCVVTNNRSFWNDEVHQERVARMRDRPVGNKWIGQRIDDADIDLAAIGRAQGAQGYGPIEDAAALARALDAAIADVERGGVAVVDVRVVGGATPASATATLPTTRKR